MPFDTAPVITPSQRRLRRIVEARQREIAGPFQEELSREQLNAIREQQRLAAAPEGARRFRETFRETGLGAEPGAPVRRPELAGRGGLAELFRGFGAGERIVQGAERAQRFVFRPVGAVLGAAILEGPTVFGIPAFKIKGRTIVAPRGTTVNAIKDAIERIHTEEGLDLDAAISAFQDRFEAVPGFFGTTELVGSALVPPFALGPLAGVEARLAGAAVRGAARAPAAAAVTARAGVGAAGAATRAGVRAAGAVGETVARATPRRLRAIVAEQTGGIRPRRAPPSPDAAVRATGANAAEDATQVVRGTKQPWELTRSEWTAAKGELRLAGTGADVGRTGPRALDQRIANLERFNFGVEGGLGATGRLPVDHKAVIRKALAENQPIPENVLAEYPDLVRGAGAPAAVSPPVPQPPAPRSRTSRTTITRGGETLEVGGVEDLARIARGEQPQVIVTAPKRATAQVERVQRAGRQAPEAVPPRQAREAHVETAAPDGPQPPAPPPTARAAAGATPPEKPSDILADVAEKATKGERPDQTLLRRHEAAITISQRQVSTTVQAGNDQLKAAGIGVMRQGQLVPRASDIPQLDELFKALHAPSRVASGEIVVPENLRPLFDELRQLTDWETAATLDFDATFAKVDDYFFRGWKPPEGAFAASGRERGRLVTRPGFKKPRTNATYAEMRELGFEPLFWNPYQQWGTRRLMGVRYREQMALVDSLKSLGDEFAQPHSGGPIPKGWRVPEIGPAFEGKSFATVDGEGQATAMFTRRWIVPNNVANTLENIYGKRPQLGKAQLGPLNVDLLKAIDAATFIPKRVKLFGSFFQQVDFLNRSGAGSWTRAVDDLLRGRPVSAVAAVARYPQSVATILRANFSPGFRRTLKQQLDDTTPLVRGKPGVNFKGISEAGLSTIDVTIFPRDVTSFPRDMDELVRSVADESGILGMSKGVLRMVTSLESAMRRGLFEGVYTAAITQDIKNTIAPMIVRNFPKATDAQINGMIARTANIKFSTIPASQSVFQDRYFREILRRVFFSIGESEGLLRQATGALRGPNARFWRTHWAGTFLFLVSAAEVIHFASTGQLLPFARFAPISRDHYGPLPFGYNRDFAAPNVPFTGRNAAEITLDLAGQMDTALRVLNPGSFLSARMSAPLRAFTNQLSGTDFFGTPIDDVGPGGVVSRTVQLVTDLFSPIGPGQALTEIARERIPGLERVVPEGEGRLGTAGLGVQATGLNLRAESTTNLLIRASQELGLTRPDGSPIRDPRDLAPSQRNQIEAHPVFGAELGKRQETAVARRSEGAIARQSANEIDQRRFTQETALVRELNTQQIPGDRRQQLEIFRDTYGDIQLRAATRRSQLNIDFKRFQEERELPDDPFDRALVQYYDAFDQATTESGRLDFDRLDSILDSLNRRWTPAQKKHVEENTGLAEHPPEIQEFIRARQALRPYWEAAEGPERNMMRLERPDIDVALVRWYGYQPRTLQGFEASQVAAPQPSGRLRQISVEPQEEQQPRRLRVPVWAKR